MKILFQYWGPSFFALALFLTFPAFAGDGPMFSSRIWQTDEGLPNNSVAAIVQTADGYLWIGTSDGLARFNGIQFENYLPEITPGLNGRVIRALCEGTNGELWIGTDDGGLFCWQNGEFSQPIPSLVSVAVKVIRRTPDGSLWFGTTGGLIRYQRGEASVLKADADPSPRIVVSLCEDAQGELWVGTTTGLQRYDRESRRLLNMDPIQKMWISALMSDANNQMWIGTAGHGLLRYKDNEVTRLIEASRIPEGFINALCEDDRGNFWIGTMGGLCRREGNSILPQSGENGASFDSILCLMRDREENLWLGTREGLVQLRPRIFQNYTKDNGLLHGNAMSVFEDRETNIWISTWGGGLNRIGVDGQIVSFHHRNSGLNHDFPLALSQRRDGSIWIGCEYDGGLFRYRKDSDGNEIFVNYAPALPLLDRAVRVLLDDSQGRLWAGASGSLYCYQNGRARRFTAEDGLPVGKVRAILEDSRQRIWIGTEGGLAMWNDEGFTIYNTDNGLSSHAILALYEDREQNLWVGTRGGGLNRIKNSNKEAPSASQVSHFTTHHGLFSDSISEILEDDRGYLWMSCFSGLFRVLKQDLADFDLGKIPSVRCASYGKEDGMASAQCNGVAQPAGWKARDGRIWFPTTRGVVVVDPASVRESLPPPVVIEEVVADKRSIQQVGAESGKVRRRESENTHLPAFSPAHLLIPPGRGELEFHYTALSFTAPEKNRFKYRLEGFDADWIQAGTRRIAYYNNLRPGSYSFHVMGCNNNGVWNPIGSSVKISLLPYFWQTWWFLGFCGIATVAFVGGTARFLTRQKMQRKLERLEQQHVVEKERTRIARDMHDELGARLTEIRVLGDLTEKNKDHPTIVASQSRRIGSAAGELIHTLHSIVWAVNPSNDSLQELADYICEFAQSFLKASSIRCRLERPDLPTDLPVSAEVRHNVALVVKEALNNVVKHADASEVRIALSLRDSQFVISIADNGKGFQSANDSRGNGLQNMKKRIESIRGCCELQSEVGRGTTIHCAIPIQNGTTN